MKQSACGLDCYDGCTINYDEHNDKISGDTSHPVTNGALCALLNRYQPNAKRIEKPQIDGKEVSIDEAINEVAKVIKDNKTLLWRGSGNVGAMQEITNLLMENVGGYLTKGSLCDGAGEAGILEGRGVNLQLPLEQIASSEVAVVWGRNITVTNSHLIPFLKNKIIIVIDPIKTEIAKKAHLHLQIAPRSDFYLAILLSRFMFIEEMLDKEWLEKFAPDYDDYSDFVHSFRIKTLLSLIDINLDALGDMLSLLQDKKTVFLVGAGVQRNSIGHYTIRAIDGLAALLGLFGKEGCGVSYIGDSKLGFENPFKVNCPTVSKVLTPFDRFNTVIVQGGNPACSMPCSLRVINKLKSVKNLIYFGLYENETSTLARIVIPAKNFYEKDDVRLNYGHTLVAKMNKLYETQMGISEYDFVFKLFNIMNLVGLQNEEYYVDYYLKQCEKIDELYRSPAHRDLPYSDGFGKYGKDRSVFLDDYDDDFIDLKKLRKYCKEKIEQDIDEYWLINSKSKHALNSQYERDDTLYIYPNNHFYDGEKIRVTSEHGEAIFVVKFSEKVRKDCIMILTNAIGINNLTPPIESIAGNSACYGEVKVRLNKL
ncbi:MAG: molybdopterin-dependent oxidoreductase [Sulfurovaceae bacterium]|nr:molybdopterin-dependent oxidoreductase [Sulfurovaceae bacterium]